MSIAWNAQGSGNVSLYLSYSATASDDNELLIASVPASAGAYTWNTTGMAPGTYYIHANLNGATSSIGPLVVNTAPLVRIDAPSPLTGEEYAYAQKAASWDGNNPNQFESTRNINNLTFAPDSIHGVPTNGDPYLMWLSNDTANAIDASKYHYFNARLHIEPPASRPWSPNNFGTRLLWAASNNVFSTSFVVTGFYNRWLPIAVDLRNVPLSGGQANDWNGTKTSFRFDPLEEDDSQQPPVLPAGFTISAAHLTFGPGSRTHGQRPGSTEGNVHQVDTFAGNGHAQSLQGDIDSYRVELAGERRAVLLGHEWRTGRQLQYSCRRNGRHEHQQGQLTGDDHG